MLLDFFFVVIPPLPVVFRSVEHYDYEHWFIFFFVVVVSRKCLRKDGEVRTTNASLSLTESIQSYGERALSKLPTVTWTQDYFVLFGADFEVVHLV